MTAAAKDGASPARAVKAMKVEPGPITRTVALTGTIAADEQVILALKATGRIADIAVDLGSRVRRGQVLARLNPTDFELGVQQAEAALQQARARLGLTSDSGPDVIDPERTAVVRQAKAVLEDARLARDRRKVFVERGISARADLDAAEAALQVAEGRYQDALEEIRNREAVLAQRRSELAIARQRLEDTVLRSPIDGMVRERHAFVGEYRAAGTSILTVVQIDPLRLRLDVPERAAADVQRGQKVRVTVEGSPVTYEATVMRIGAAITEGNRTLPVEAELRNPGGTLRPGTFVRAEIFAREDRGLLVPRGAIVTFAGVDKVLTVRDGTAREKAVQIGARTGDHVEIVQGLVAGDTVIVEPGNLTDGTRVTLRN